MKQWVSNRVKWIIYSACNICLFSNFSLHLYIHSCNVKHRENWSCFSDRESAHKRYLRRTWLVKNDLENEHWREFIENISIQFLTFRMSLIFSYASVLRTDNFFRNLWSCFDRLSFVDHQEKHHLRTSFVTSSIIKSSNDIKILIIWFFCLIF